MAQHIHRSNKVQSSRKERFNIKFMEDLEKLVRAVATEICQNHIRVRNVGVVWVWHRWLVGWRYIARVQCGYSIVSLCICIGL